MQTIPPPALARAPLRGRPPTAGLRDKILAAAERIFSRCDYHEMLMDDVARVCGVAKGTVYRYFPSKRALYLAVMFDGLERLRDRLQAAVDAPDDPVCKIERIAHCILAYVWDQRFFFGLIHRIEDKPDDPETREWLRRRTEISAPDSTRRQQAIAAGHLRPIDAHLATEMLLGMLRGVGRYRTAKDQLADSVAIVVTTFLRGVATPAGLRRARSTETGACT